MRWAMQWMRTWLARGSSLAIVAILAASTSFSQQPPDPPRPEPEVARGFAYVGAFLVTNIDTQISLFSTRFPVGARVDLNQDLGLENSLTVPRATVAYRFGKSHVLSANWYRLKRTSTQVLDRELEIGGEVIPINTKAETSFRTEFLKVGYTWMFHRDTKVSLGIGAGLFFHDIDFSLQVKGNVVKGDVDEGILAPLPVLGGRIGYNITPRWSLTLTADWFFIRYDRYAGIFTDVQAYVHHRTFKHVGFGAGVTLDSLRGEFEDDNVKWELESGFVGFLGAVTFYF